MKTIKLILVFLSWSLLPSLAMAGLGSHQAHLDADSDPSVNRWVALIAAVILLAYAARNKEASDNKLSLALGMFMLGVFAAS